MILFYGTCFGSVSLGAQVSCAPGIGNKAGIACALYLRRLSGQ